MKKSILALAVAAALTTPLAVQADTILYGSARASINYLDQDDNNDFWDVVNDDSRLGVTGSEDLGGGLSAVYQYEFGVDLTEGGNLNSNRPKLVGLKGGFGTLTIGTQETPYYHVAGVTDIFNSSFTFGGDAWLGGFVSDQRGPGSLTRLSNSIFYSTPDFSGFSGEVMLVVDGSVNDAQGFSDSVDIWNIALKYNNGPFFAGISYIALDGDNNVFIDPVTLDFDVDQWTVGLGYAAGPFSVGFIYEQGTVNQYGLVTKASVDGIRIGGDDATNFLLAGSYTFGNNIISAAYGQLDPGTRGEDEIDNYILGYQYNFSKRTRIWAEYVGRSADNVFYSDQNVVSIGTRVDF
ncbi:MAG TPA: porin [Candidatus Competibacter sp.]|nr:porin [Candidatus Competibacter sp.]